LNLKKVFKKSFFKKRKILEIKNKEVLIEEDFA